MTSSRVSKALVPWLVFSQHHCGGEVCSHSDSQNFAWDLLFYFLHARFEDQMRIRCSAEFHNNAPCGVFIHCAGVVSGLCQVGHL